MSYGFSSHAFYPRPAYRGSRSGSGTILHTFEFDEDEDRAPEDVRITYTIQAGSPCDPRHFDPGTGDAIELEIPEGYSLTPEEKTQLMERISDTHDWYSEDPEDF